MPHFDALHYSPPAPIAIVALKPSDAGGEVGDVVMLIDTGADMTLLPRSAVIRLGVPVLSDPQDQLIGFDGSRSTADSVDLDMVFLNKAFRGHYLITEDAHGILGRDVLASCRLLFDGPGQQWLEWKAAP